MASEIVTLTTRLTKGAALLWSMEEAGEMDTPDYTRYLDHFEDLLADYRTRIAEEETR